MQCTLSDVMNAINSSSAGVKITYDSLNDRFIMESKTMGATSEIELTDTDPANGLLKAMGLSEEPILPVRMPSLTWTGLPA